jgi:predicted GNAT family acetyltransferase
MQLIHLADVDAFLGRAHDFLVAREAEHNLMLGICSDLQASEVEVEPQVAPRFAVVVDEGGQAIAATLRTPPLRQVLSETEELAAIDLIVGAIADAGESLPGVLGPKEAARRFAELWRERTGHAAELSTSERIFQLTEVVRPRPSKGWWRVAKSPDRKLLAKWIVAFHDEAVPDDPAIRDPVVWAERWIEGIGRQAYVWECEGRPTSFLGVSGATPNGIRIGPVYTPPEERGRGYASNLTAGVSQHLLDSGRHFCFLFTNLANPTSNKIYLAIGYRPVTDVDAYLFDRADHRQA